jgi:hypothetical protein
VVVDAPAADAAAATRGWLSADEADFIQAACALILPEARQLRASAYVDRKLGELSRSAASAQTLALYREGVARIQTHCRLEYGRSFQALAVWHQLAVLARFEAPESALHDLRAFVLTLVNDVAEAYFEAPPRTALQ